MVLAQTTDERDARLAAAVAGGPLPLPRARLTDPREASLDGTVTGVTTDV